MAKKKGESVDCIIKYTQEEVIQKLVLILADLDCIVYICKQCNAVLYDENMGDFVKCQHPNCEDDPYCSNCYEKLNLNPRKEKYWQCAKCDEFKKIHGF